MSPDNDHAETERRVKANAREHNDTFSYTVSSHQISLNAESILTSVCVFQGQPHQNLKVQRLHLPARQPLRAVAEGSKRLLPGAVDTAGRGGSVVI